MIKISDTQARFAITVGSLLLGILLALLSFLSGNKPIIEADLRASKDYIWENKIYVDDLASWLVKGKRDFLLIGFRNQKDCILQQEKTRFFSCYPIENYKDISWLRKKYPNLLIPMVVYGQNTDESFDIAVQLRYYGYNTRMLEGGFNRFDSEYLQASKLIDKTNNNTIKRMRLYEFFTGKQILN
ncbi:MAG: hypothetical protein HOC24_13050 [Deltaproteobacteria bacterium]|jgi:hypothetical protein|nr:hypothetical protein [Deltaproteobacteria bacterium]